MPNWCYNTVRFQGGTAGLEKLEKLFNALADLERETGHGQLPRIYQGDEGHLFDTGWEDGELHYVTRWVPNTPVILAVAVSYGAGFTHRYEETGNQIYGQTRYAGGEIWEAELDKHDFSQYTYDEEREIYRFGGRDFDSDTEILDILLERKLQACGLAG